MTDTAPRVQELDYDVLRGGGLRARLAAVGRSNRMLIAGTVILLLVVATGSLLVALAVTGHLGDDVGLTVCAAMFFLVGLYAVADLLGQAGSDASLASFAKANGLRHLSHPRTDHYAAPVLRSGRHLVQEAVRTPGEAYLEIGDRFPVGDPISSEEARTPLAYLRATLPGPTSEEQLLTPELRQALRAWAGSYELDVASHELTVLASVPLDARGKGRVRDGLVLLEQLVARVEPEERAVPATPEPTASGIPVPDLPTTEVASRRRSPLLVVGVTVAVLVGGPLLFALVMDNVDDALQGRPSAAKLVVLLVVGLLVAAIGGAVRWAMTSRRADDP